MICSYLSDRKQRIKINNAFSAWNNVILGVALRPVLGSLLFNIYLNDLFSFLKDAGICNFVDDTTTYISDKSLKNVLMKLNTDNFGIVSDNFSYFRGYKHD